MTAAIQPPLPAFGPGPALGLSFGGTSSNQTELPVLPPVGALMSMHMRPIARARSADDVAGPGPRPKCVDSTPGMTTGLPRADLTQQFTPSIITIRKASPALAQFAADWGRLPRAHPRFADGASILHKVNPRTIDNSTIEVLPQAPRVGNISTLLRSSELDLVNTELERLTPDRCVCTAGPGADLRSVLASLESGEPLVVGVHAPLQDGLGAIQPPIRLPQNKLHQSGPHSSAVILGTGAIARTTTPLNAPVLTRQVVGRSLVVYWTPISQRRVPPGTAFMTSMNRMMCGATLRSVTLSPGQWCVLPKGSVYVTLALGDNHDGTTTPNFAVQVKFTIHLPASIGADIAAIRVGDKRKLRDDNDDEERFSQSSRASSYASSANGDNDCTCESDEDDCYECRATRLGRSSKRARTADYDHYDFATTANEIPTPVDYMVTRNRDSIVDRFPSPLSLSHYKISNSKNFSSNMYF